MIGHSYPYSKPRIAELRSALVAGISIMELLQPGQERVYVNGNRQTALEIWILSLSIPNCKVHLHYHRSIMMCSAFCNKVLWKI